MKIIKVSMGRALGHSMGWHLTVVQGEEKRAFTRRDSLMCSD